MRVILDTNFLIDLFRFKVGLEEIFDIFPDAQLCVLQPSVGELQKIAKSKSKDSKYAKVSLAFRDGIKILECDEPETDNALLNFSKDSVIATNDRTLRKKITEKGGKVIYLRAKKHLALG